MWNEIPEDIKEPSALVYGLDNEKYHAMPGLSKSGIDHLQRSPAHYQAWKQTPQVETLAMKLGSLIHCAVLEPECFHERYYVGSNHDKRTTVGKANAAAEAKDAGERILISMDEDDMANNIMLAVVNHPIASQLLDGGHAEVSVFAELDGVECRCRPDYLIDSLIIDVKSTDDAGPGFINSVSKYNYHIQSSFYLDVCKAAGLDVDHFLFLAVEKKAPWCVALYELDEDSIVLGRWEYKQCLEVYKQCLETGVWPGYSEDIKTLRLPNYMLKDL